MDIGSGRGEMLLAAKELGWKSFQGIEPSIEFATFIEDKYGICVISKELKDAHFSDDFFDIVVMSAVLNHLFNPKEIIKEVSRIIKPNGLLYIEIENEEGIRFKIGNLYNRILGRNWITNLSPTFTPYHIYGFSPKTIIYLLTAGGFKIVELRTFSGRKNNFPKGNCMLDKLEAIGYALVTMLSKISGGSYMRVFARKKIQMQK